LKKKSGPLEKKTFCEKFPGGPWSFFKTIWASCMNSQNIIIYYYLLLFIIFMNMLFSMIELKKNLHSFSLNLKGLLICMISLEVFSLYNKQLYQIEFINILQ